MIIPAELRKELGIQPGERLVARAEDGRLVLERRDAILARLQALFAHIPRDVSLADELIAERRAEARRSLPMSDGSAGPGCTLDASALLAALHQEPG